MSSVSLPPLLPQREQVLNPVIDNYTIYLLSPTQSTASPFLLTLVSHNFIDNEELVEP